MACWPGFRIQGLQFFHIERHPGVLGKRECVRMQHPVVRRGCGSLLAWRMLVFLEILPSFVSIRAQNNPLFFKQLSTSDGLSMANVQAIVRDGYGFMWIGTEDGLNRYDGCRFTAYFNRTEDEHSLTNSYIGALLCDRKNRLWVGTRDGLNRYVPETDQFIRIPAADRDSLRPANRDIKDLFEDSRGNIWIAGSNGVDCLDHATGAFRHFQNDPGDPSSLSYNTCYDVAEDSRGRIWIATERGLNLLDPASGKCRRFLPEGNAPHSISAPYIRCVLADRGDNLWIGTYENGLEYFDSEKGRFVRIGGGRTGRSGISLSQINDLAFDWDGNLLVGTTEGLDFLRPNRERLQDSRISRFSQGGIEARAVSANPVQRIWVDSTRIWLSTRFGGVNLFDKYGSKFRKFSNVAENGLSYPNVTSFSEDENGRVYIGTDGGGVTVFDPSTETFRHIKHSAADPNSLANNKVLAVLFDAPGTLWIGMWDGGVDRLDLRSGRIVHCRHRAGNPRTLSSDNVFCLFRDRLAQIWVGTWGGGLNRYVRKNDSFIRYPANVTDGSGTNGTTIMSLYEDNQGRIWIATEGRGLDCYDRRTRGFTHHVHEENNSRTISSDYVNAVLQDSKNRLWMTTTAGLNLFDPGTGSFTSFRKSDGLPAETLYGLCEDSEGDLWVSSVQGLSEVTVAEKDGKTSIRCSNYHLQDGLQGEQFGQWAYFKSRSGMMYFGGINGFNCFYPTGIRRNPVPPRVWISDLQLSLKPVSFRDRRSPLTKPMYLTETLKISHRENMLSFDFIALGYTQPETNRYAYLLENFDKENDWHALGTDRRATYTNLDPGSYVLRVKASNNDGVWNETGASLRLVVTPPFWATWAFRGFLIACAGGAAAVGIRWLTNRNEIHRRKLHEQILRTEELKSKNEAIEASNRKLSDTGRTLANSSMMVKQTVSMIDGAMEEVMGGVISQDESVDRTMRMIDQLMSNTHMVVFQTKISTRAADETLRAVDSGVSTMQKSLDSMQNMEHVVGDSWNILRGLVTHSERVDDIIGMIDDVASRVNVLALNAMVESAKAGESGSGFRVVAREIRELAKRLTAATSGISDFIAQLQRDVTEIEAVTARGVQTLQDSSKSTDVGRNALDEIHRSMEQERERLTTIAENAGKMQEFSVEVQKAIENMASVARINRDSIVKVGECTVEMGSRIQELSELAHALAYGNA